MRQGGYIICTTPRSGSTLLCQMLANSGQAGRPNSFFRREDIPDWATDWRVPHDTLPGSPHPTRAYLDAARVEGQGGTPVFGLRLMYESLQGLMAYLRRVLPPRPNDHAYLVDAFGPVRFVHLHRRDTVGQAISLMRAEQSGLWHRAADGSDIERMPPTATPGYDFDRLHHHADRLHSDKAGWKTWFAEQRIEALDISYEALAADPLRVLADLHVDLGLSKPAIAAAPTDVLRDDLSEDWRRRYMQDVQRRGQSET